MIQYKRLLSCCAVLLFAWVTAANADPTINWTVDELIAPLADASVASAVVVADEPGVADVVWLSIADGDQYYTQFVNGVKSIDAETVFTGNSAYQLGISRRYDGKLRVGIVTGHYLGVRPNFKEFTRDGTDDWSLSGPASPAVINGPYAHMGGYDVDPCTGLGAFMIWDANDTIRYYRETAQDTWTTGVDVQIGDEFWYSGFCDFLITPDGAPIGAYKMRSVAPGVHAGELDPCGGAITSVIPGSGYFAWTSQSMAVAADGTIYHVNLRSATAPKVQVSKSENNGSTWTNLGVPGSILLAYAQGDDIQIAVAPDESQMALLAYSPTAGDYSTTLYLSEPNLMTDQELGEEWYSDPCWLPYAGDLDLPDVAYDPTGNLYVVYCRNSGDADKTGVRLLSNAPLLVDADVDNDGDVDFGDWVILASNWLESSGDMPCDPLLAGSIDNDCDVDLHDFNLMVANWTGAISTEPGAFTLVAGGANPANIIVNSTDPTIQTAAYDLAEKLGAISGAEFSVDLGNGNRGIVVGLADDFEYLPANAAVFGDGPDPNFASEPFLREQYRIYSTNDAVCLIGKTPLAVQHAVWDLLYHLGYRQYFPRSTWEYVPSNDTLSVELNIDEVPDYRARQIWYNGGYLKYYPEWDNATSLEEWYARNRMANGFGLRSSHNYQGIVSRNQSVFDANPEYYALVGGARESYHTNVKLCIDNPGLVAISNLDAINTIAANPERDSVSRDPSDSGGWCECDGTYDAVHNPDSTNCTGNFSSITDRAVYLANKAAQALIDTGYTDKYIGMLGYNYHSDPPEDTTVHPNVFVSIARGFLSGNYTYRELLAGWQGMGATLGVYDYFSVYQWDLSKPRSAGAAYPRDLASDTRDFYNLNARFHSAESGDSWAPHGLGYYVANRVMWDVDEADNVEAMIEEFLSNMFGPASNEMRDFYDLINKDKQLRSSDNLLGTMYKYLDDGVIAAAGNPKVLARIYDLIKYTRFFELRTVYEADTGNVGNKEALLTWVYRIRLDGLVHAFRLWSVFGLITEALSDPDYYLKDANDIDEAEVLSTLSAGRSTFGDPPDPYPSFLDDFVVYSEDLVPAAAPMGLTHPAGDGVNPIDSQNTHYYWLWVDPCQTTITFDVMTDPVGGKLIPEISLYHNSHGEDPVDTQSWNAADPSWHRLTFNTPYSGLHQAILYDGGGNQTAVDWQPADANDTALATMPSGLSQNYSQLFRFWAGYWRAFFYVPTGTTTVGLWAGAPVGSVRDNNNSVVLEWVGNGYPNEWYEVAVPPGQDGKVWNMITNRGMRVMTTVPPYFAKTVDNLLLPREVVYGVSPGQASIPSPGIGAPGVALDADFSWTVGQATATQKLYLDTVNPPVNLEADLSGSDSSYDPGPLLSGTTYHWRLDTSNVNGQTAGTVWSFTTN